MKRILPVVLPVLLCCIACGTQPSNPNLAQKPESSVSTSPASATQPAPAEAPVSPTPQQAPPVETTSPAASRGIPASANNNNNNGATNLKLPPEAIIGFYNVENLYDTKDDPAVDDADFLPTGKYSWTPEAYQLKLGQLAKAISSLGGIQGPDVFGLVEIENRQVVADLIKTGALSKRAYAIAHEDSRDERGVDAALVYDTRTWSLVQQGKYSVTLPDPTDRTRDILFVELKAKRNGTSVFFLVNHWPSRREGSEKSEPNRLAAAKVLRSITDKLFRANINANIVVMGDFNDDPENKSIAEVLGAELTPGGVQDGEFYSTLVPVHDPNTRGSLPYDEKWNLFDQLIVSGNMLETTSPVQYVAGSANIFDAEWLQVGFGRAKDNPRRFIYRDQVQKEGFSDHFPVYMKLALK